MIVQRSSTDTLERSDAHNRSETRLSGPWPLIGWIAAVLLLEEAVLG